MVNVFLDNPDPECVVHRLIEEVPKELNHIWVVLGLK